MLKILMAMFGGFMALLGGCLNFLVLSSNDCRMPVNGSHVKGLLNNSTKYISVAKSKNIKHAYLIDKYRIKISKDRCLILSLGDIFICCGVIILLIGCII